MRIRAVVAIALLLLPAALEAQRLRLPRVGGRRPAPPTDLPPQPQVVARELAYRRLNLSVESYPLVSHIQSPALTGNGVLSSTTAGAGTRLDYRLTRHLSATLDMTTSFLFGSSLTSTVELGTRLRPERSERRVYPFIDVRVGYVNAIEQSSGQVFDFGATDPASSRSRFSRGFGGVGGAGMEIALTRTFSLTTAASVMRSHMTVHPFHRRASTDDSFAMTSYRYTAGIRWNPVRIIRRPGTD
jgi:hypothetical protein